ncbi:serine/threonine-protein kinase PAK1 [Dendryphion nanum]|uniref:non-specific serine/threonine protein kinase n=1 Tax=Dendryphion nanum TaxID=256645 RepID=A0A9P9ILZ1_9PLEO|nr:serine/threonine-protein kinase PAK1 [Dendryphion nanum]
MGDPNMDLTAGVEPITQEQSQPHSPASVVCYMDRHEAQKQPSQGSASADMTACNGNATRARQDISTPAPNSRTGEESDSTPRSELPSTSDCLPPLPQDSRLTEPEPGYFSPRPVRIYGSKFSASAPASTDPSPTTSVNVSTTSVHIPEHRSTQSVDYLTLSPDLHERPSVQRDLSNTSTTSVATVRAHSVDPITAYPPPSRLQRDGPHYPNQSYAALQSQFHPGFNSPHFPRTRSTLPSHGSSHSTAHISTFGLPSEFHYSVMDSGSRTVGNSPAGSPGLFSPTTPPLRHKHSQNVDDGYYSSPYLHHTHRQAPKETHTADVDVDPVSGRKIINNYEVIDELGRGVHGKVKLGRNLDTGVFVAIKIVERYSKRRRLGKNSSHEDKIKKEIAILKKARHQNIVSLLEVIDDPTRKKVYIILEHVELGEVKWRTLGEKEICLIEYRRYQRHSKGIFDNENAVMEDNKILTHAHERLDRRIRRRARTNQMRRTQHAGQEHEPWSFEHGGDSDDETFPEGGHGRIATHLEGRPPSRDHETNMETAYRTTTPVAAPRHEERTASTGLEGTMYGAYDTDLLRGRTPSVAESSSSHFTDEDESIPEHFLYVPLMTMQGAREAFRDTLLGLQYLHYQGVIHRDIKPANLLQTKEHRIKISDFGVSYLGRGGSGEPNGDQSESEAHDYDEAIELAKTVGTPAFYAPELCRTDLDEDVPPIGAGIDIWALGVTLYCLIYGRVPFHDYNTFHLMKIITDTEVYIPNTRLKAVSEQSGSRPSSHGRMYQSMTTNKRSPHDLEYEEVDDLLRDLLRRLLVKDPRRRITMSEIKLHPWVLQGLENVNAWALETDPKSFTHGRKIQVSKDDVEQAVVPITLIDRVRSGVRKMADTVLGMGRRGGSRRRAQSTATSPEQVPVISAHSSSSTISQEGRRPSLAMNQSIFEALSRSREPEHPLSQSVTASPEVAERPRYFEATHSRTGSPAHSLESNEHPAPLVSSGRPLPERAHSTMSSAASVRTIRASDILQSGRPVSPNLPPALPGTPTALDSPGGTNLGGIFGGVPRRIVNSMRSRERMLKPPHEHMRAKSIDRLVPSSDDGHSGPSLAISTALAAGHVDQPDLLKDLSPTLVRGASPCLSDSQHRPSSERAFSVSRQSSISSASSYRSRPFAGHNQLDVGSTELDAHTQFALQRHGSIGSAASHAHSTLLRQASEDQFKRAKEELVRQRVREETDAKERPQSMHARRPPSALSQSECPPSPDDEIYFRQQKVQDYLDQRQRSSLETSPANYATPVQNGGLASSSSEDHFASMSQSTSNPSIPSVASANSSVAADDCYRPSSTFPAIASEDSFNQFRAPTEDPAGYDGDHPLESDDDESDDDDFIVMGGKKKKPATRLSRSESVSNAELARSNIRKEIMSHRRRSARSGSNGTVKKVPPPGESDPDQTTPQAQEQSL